ncbi:PH domain-containing protein [Herbaspirillum sp. GCM10030257]|uniref:PH domain-containing protein n=1 Tax=Herbaspirillum sp. GCM10030257 TaxID=3273393 RepID=UPI0036165295
MASYVESILSKNEKITYEGRISLWSLAPNIILGVLLLPAMGAGLIFLVLAWLKYISTELAITNKRVVAKFGFIRRRTVEINLAKIESIQVDQGILGRVFGYGSLIVAGAGTPQAPIPGISDPIAFRKAFMATQEEHLPALTA